MDSCQSSTPTRVAVVVNAMSPPFDSVTVCENKCAAVCRRAGVSACQCVGVTCSGVASPIGVQRLEEQQPTGHRFD